MSEGQVRSYRRYLSSGLGPLVYGVESLVACEAKDAENTTESQTSADKMADITIEFG